MAFSVTTGNPIPTKEVFKAKCDELKAFLKCVKGNGPRLLALCDIGAVSGYALDPESCVEIPKSKLGDAMSKMVTRLVDGVEVNGEDGNFSTGGFGSRWMDLNEWARENGLTYVRCAFYSRKFHDASSGPWQFDKPYAIQVMVELAKKS